MASDGKPPAAFREKAGTPKAAKDYYLRRAGCSAHMPRGLIEARRFSGLAIDTLVELTKTKYPSSTRYTAATALLDRGYGRPAQSLDLHLSADAITKRLSDMTDAELAALEARMITLPATVALEHGDEPQAGGDTGAEQDGDGCVDDEAANM